MFFPHSYLKGSRFSRTAARQSNHLSETSAAHHKARRDHHVCNRRFHDAPRPTTWKETTAALTEQRLKLWMNLAVKIPKSFAAMAN